MFHRYGQAYYLETEGKQRSVWHTFNCHNFAEVFRIFLGDKQMAYLYDCVCDTKKLGDLAPLEACSTIWRGRSYYYGDMLEVVIMKLKENDETVLKCIREIIQVFN